MKVVSQSGSPVANSTESPAQNSAKERAIAKLLGSSSPSDIPVANPTRVSPEELSAIKAPTSTEPEQNSQAYTNESQSPETKAETKASEEPISSQYAVLARKEKAIRQREQQVKAREAAIKAQEQPKAPEPAKPEVDLSKFVDRDRLVKDPFTVLNELGLNYDQLTELALNAPRPEQMALYNEINSLKSELKTLRGETESTKKSFEEQQNQSYKQAVDQIRTEARSVIKNDQNFELIRTTNSLNDVVSLIEKTFNQDGILLTVEEAATEVENYLANEAIKLAKTKKIQQRLAPKAAPAAQAPQKSTGDNKQQQAKTLTNAASSTRPLTARERALLAFEGKLQK